MINEDAWKKADPERLLAERLRGLGSLDLAEIAVRVRHGVAYIQGFIPNVRQKRLVGEIAAQVEGIRLVVNILGIAPMGVVDDDDLKKHLTHSLARNPYLDEASIIVDVVEGNVRLSGSVRTATERCIVEEEAWATSGVRCVMNEVQVPTVSFEGDLDVAEEILKGLSQCLGLQSSKVEVSFREGIVYLKGAVSSQRLKSGAEDLARWTPSVADVVNDLEVATIPAPLNTSGVGSGGHAAATA